VITHPIENPVLDSRMGTIVEDGSDPRTSVHAFLIALTIVLLCGCPGFPDDDDVSRADDDDVSGDDDDTTSSEACPEPVYPCSGTCVLDIAIELERVAGSIRWDGAPVPQGDNAFELGFVAADGRERVVQVHAFADVVDTFDVPMLAGTYDIYFQWLGTSFPGSEGWPDPIHGRVWVASGFEVPRAEPLDIVLAPARVSGQLQWAGADIPANSGNQVELIFSDPEAGTDLRVPLAASSAPLSEYDIPMLPGTYDVSFQWLGSADPGNAAWPDPIWGPIQVASGFVVSEEGSTLDITPSPARVTGAIQWAGADIPASSANEVELLFHTPGGAGYYVRRRADGQDLAQFDAPVPPGNYDVWFSWRSAAPPGDPAWPDPIWGWIKVSTGLAVSIAGATLDISLLPARLTGEILWDGAPIPQSIYNDWSLTFTPLDGEDDRRVLMDATAGPVGAYDIPVLPGTYDLTLQWLGAAIEDDPASPDATMEYVPVAQGLEVAPGGASLDIDLRPVRLSGELLWDGAPIPEGPYNGWWLAFHSQATGLTHQVPRTALVGDVASFDVPTFPGTWDVGFAWWTTEAPSDPGWPDPILGEIPLPAVEVPEAGGSMDISIDPRRLSGELLWGGAPVPWSEANRWALQFENADTHERLWVERDAGQDEVSAYDIPVLRGLWNIEFEWYSAAPPGEDASPDPIWRSIPVATCVWIP
jgi:hypothetical protein